MIETIQQFLTDLPVDRTTLIVIGLAFGIFLVFVRVFYPVPDTARIARRMAAATSAHSGSASSTRVIRSSCAASSSVTTELALPMPLPPYVAASLFSRSTQPPASGRRSI